LFTERAENKVSSSSAIEKYLASTGCWLLALSALRAFGFRRRNCMNFCCFRKLSHGSLARFQTIAVASQKQFLLISTVSDVHVLIERFCLRWDENFTRGMLEKLFSLKFEAESKTRLEEVCK
jgi:hypothetical protein